MLPAAKIAALLPVGLGGNLDELAPEIPMKTPTELLNVLLTGNAGREREGPRGDSEPELG